MNVSRTAEMDLPAEHFRHPYSPYDIQLQFMRNLYSCIDEGNVGIFESPTGTGKSLSLICGSLAWLRDHKRAAFHDDAADAKEDDGEPDWIIEHARRQRKQNAIAKRKEFEDRLAQVRAAEERQRKKLESSSRPSKKSRVNSGSNKPEKPDDDDFELDEYESDEETSTSGIPRAQTTHNLSLDTLALLDKLKGSVPLQTDLDDDEIRIIYCSRTHSQLAQFAQEMRRVEPLPSMPADCEAATAEEGEDSVGNQIAEMIKHVSLGSRKTLCINPQVRRLGTGTAINERCLDLQKPGTPQDQKCQFLPPRDSDVLINDFRDHVLAKVGDIEDIGKIGKNMGICPYYASRSVVKHSEVVTLPYQLLLQKSAREALGMSVKNHIIVIDEAHNLMDTISNVNSASVSLAQLRAAIQQLTIYARKYKSRLKGKNRVYIAQAIRLVSAIAGHLEAILNDKRPAEGILRPFDITSGKGTDQINPHKLSRYLQDSKLARKVDGFIEHSQGIQSGKDETGVPVLFHVQSFLIPLMNPSDEGQLFYEKTGNDVQLKYLLLDPTNHFREIVEEARAVILAGGTMSPMDDYADHLLSYAAPEKIKTFSFGHVIPQDNLIALSLSRGSHGSEFDFTYEKRNSEKMINDLGSTIAAACKVIPDGVVAFFPSYEYLNRVLKIWGTSGIGVTGPSQLDSLGKIKPLFYESQDNKSDTENLLQNYTNSIDTDQGGLLLAVMGGKLSEGINFSDRLGRGVIVIGLPFANLRSPELQAKMQHVEQKAYTRCSGSDATRMAKAGAAKRSFYENSCMRTVNQCIGRAIRHQNDYAAIIMLDRRYDTPRIHGKLPNWIQQSFIQEPSRSGEDMPNHLYRFFQNKPRRNGR